MEGYRNTVDIVNSHNTVNVHVYSIFIHNGIFRIRVRALEKDLGKF